MRKVLFQLWIEGVKTPEYKAYKGFDSNFDGKRYEDGTGIYTDMVNVGYFHGFIEGMHGEPIAHIEYQGQMTHVDTYRFKFSDTPEDEQRSEFAKAAMQGLLMNHKVIDCHTENVMKWISEHSVLQSDFLIAELKKPKP